MVRGERGGEAGGVVDMVGIEGRDAESGLQESLRRQLSLQYRIELLGVVIWFSHMAQKFKKLAISKSSWVGFVPRSFPEPSLEMVTVALEVPRRCNTGREGLDLV